MTSNTQRAHDLAMQLTNDALGITPNHKALSLDNLDTAESLTNQVLRNEHFAKSLIHAIHADIESRTLHTRSNDVQHLTINRSPGPDEDTRKLIDQINQRNGWAGMGGIV